VEVQDGERRRVDGQRIAHEMQFRRAPDEALLAGRREPCGQRLPHMAMLLGR
jgi:hypothetical protein